VIGSYGSTTTQDVDLPAIQVLLTLGLARRQELAAENRAACSWHSRFFAFAIKVPLLTLPHLAADAPHVEAPTAGP